MMIISLPRDCGQKSCTKWLALFWKKGLSVKGLPPTETGICGFSVDRQDLTHGGSLE